MLTRSELKKYKCIKHISCLGCPKRDDCTKDDAKKYRKQFKKLKDVLKQRKFYCDYVKGCCKRDKCNKYKSCRKAQKTKMDNWYKAYNEDNKDELNRLSEGRL